MLPRNGSNLHVKWSDFNPAKIYKALLQSSGLQTFRKVVTPLPLNTKLSAHEGELFQNPELYKSLVGKLNFLNTRPDLAYTVQTLSHYMQTPRTLHWEATIHNLELCPSYLWTRHCHSR